MYSSEWGPKRRRALCGRTCRTCSGPALCTHASINQAMSTSAIRSSYPHLAVVLLALAIALCVVGAARGSGRYISKDALRADLPLTFHQGHGGVPAPAAAVTTGGNHLLRHRQEQASARVDVGVQAPVAVGVGTMSSEVRHQLHA